MKNIVRIFSSIKFVLSLVYMVLYIAIGLIFVCNANGVAAGSEITVDGQILSQAEAVEFITLLGVGFLVAAVLLIPGLIIISKTLKRINRHEATAKNMLPLAILNLIFGCRVAAVFLFIMRDRHYQ